MKETEDYRNEWQLYCACELVELILLNEHITQVNLQIQCNPSQNTSDIFHRTTTNNSKNRMGILQWLRGKECACQGRRQGFNLWSRKTPHALK